MTGGRNSDGVILDSSEALLPGIGENFQFGPYMPYAAEMHCLTMVSDRYIFLAGKTKSL